MKTPLIGKEIQELLDDRKRLEWVLENLIENPSDAPTLRLAAAMMLGKKGRAVIDTAMEVRP